MALYYRGEHWCINAGQYKEFARLLYIFPVSDFFIDDFGLSTKALASQDV